MVLTSGHAFSATLLLLGLVDERARATADDGVQAIQDAAGFLSPEQLLLIGPPSVADDEQNEMIRVRDREFHGEAKRLGIRFVSTFRPSSLDAAWMRQVAAGDGYHPDAAGYAHLAAVIEPVFLDWLLPTR